LTTVRGGKGVSTASSESSTHEEWSEKLYPAHIPTSCLQKAILAAGSSLVGLMDPWRPDMVAVSGEVTGAFALRYMRATMADDPEGRKVLDQQPRINTHNVDMDALRRLPEHTLGHVYATYNDRYGITPDSRDTVRFVDDDPELAYVMQRYREVHDVTHAILGMPTNLVGEVAVK
jgi:ubiquinone biosynthesis protein Coq4